jgi:hypothetical protein
VLVSRRQKTAMECPLVKRLLKPVALAALFLPALSCADGGERTERAAEAGVDFGQTAAYERRFVFLGPGQRLPTAAVMDFVALNDGEGLQRGMRARVADGTDWHRVADAGWEMERMRDPWRLVPHGPLRLVVGETGELSALVLRGDAEFRLEPGALLAEHTPDAGTQLVLRQGRLDLGGELVPGILLDAQLGRAHSVAAARERRRLNAESPDRAGVPDATPAAQPGVESLLLDNSGYFLVLATSAAGPLAWIHHAGQDEVRAGARLEAIGWEPAEDGSQVANAWRLTIEDVVGELVAEVADGVALDATPGAGALGYAIVSGWLEERGVRRDLFGLVRHVH